MVKTKICNIGDDPGGAIRTNVENFQEDLVRVWHEVYGTVPEEIRVILNSNSFTILGAAYGGLPSALVGQGLDRLVVAMRGISLRAKEVAVSEEWKAGYANQIVALAGLQGGIVITNGVDGLVDLDSKEIQAAAYRVLDCIDSAEDPGQAKQCMKQTAIYRIERYSNQIDLIIQSVSGR